MTGKNQPTKNKGVSLERFMIKDKVPIFNEIGYYWMSCPYILDQLEGTGKTTGKYVFDKKTSLTFSSCDI